MKNPVQQMLKAGSRMKNNPPLAQREASSPNKINSIAAQMVIPEQQAMQKSRPIPYPVGSVLMQKLAQAQQAAAAAQMPQPNEGGIAQMAAKGGVLKFAKRGKVPKDPLPEDLITSEENSIRNLGEQLEQGRKDVRNQRNNKAELGLGKEPAEQKKLTSQERGVKTALQRQDARMDRNAAAIDKAVAKAKKGVADEAATKRAAQATERQKIRGMGQKLEEQGKTPASRIPQGQRSIGRAAGPDYRAQGIEQAASKQAKAAATERTIGSGLQNPTERAPAREGKAPSYDISSHGGRSKPQGPTPQQHTPVDREKAFEQRKAAKYAADKAAEEAGVEPKKVSKEAQAYKKERLGSEARVAEAQQPGSTFEESGIGRKRYLDKKGNVIEPSKKMASSSPATLMESLTGGVKNFFSKNPDLMEGARKVAKDVLAKNPEATMDEIGAAIKRFASPESIQAMEAEIAPTLEKHGLRDFFNSTKGGIQDVASGAKGWAKTHPGTVGAGVGLVGGVAEKLMSRGKDADMSDVGEATVEGLKDAATGAAIGKIPVVGNMYNVAGALMPFYENMVPEETQRAIAKPGVNMIRGIEKAAGDEFNKYFPGAHAAESSADKDAWLEKVGTPESAAALDAFLSRQSGEAPSEGVLALPSMTTTDQSPAARTVPQSQAPTTPKSAPPAPQSQRENITTGDPTSQQGGIATSPEAPKLPGQQDQYAGDTSEGTPEGAVQELMKLRGPGYQYSPEVMGMLKDARDEDRQATMLSMIGAIGTGLSNRDRYAGAHDAGLLANQAFTSGREREDKAQQQFLQGIIHNEQVPYEQRQAAYEMYTKMQMASAQNEALYGRALLNADTRRYGYNMGYAGKVASGGGRDWAEKQDIDGLHIMLKSIDKELESKPGDPVLTAQAKEIRTRLANLSGLAGDQGLGQTTPITTLKM